jgi:hypothetical protein
MTNDEWDGPRGTSIRHLSFREVTVLFRSVYDN